jgi:hypothetical protein
LANLDQSERLAFPEAVLMKGYLGLACAVFGLLNV